MKAGQLRVRSLAVGALILALALTTALAGSAAAAGKIMVGAGFPQLVAGKILHFWLPFPGADAVEVTASLDTTTDFKVLTSLPGAATNWIQEEVKEGVTYNYKIVAKAGGQVIGESDVVKIVIPAKAKPLSPPQIRGERVQDGQIMLSWVLPEGKALAYNVYRSPTKDGKFEMVASVQDTKYTDAKVEAGKEYWYAVAALDAAFKETAKSEPKAVAVPSAEQQKAAEDADKRQELIPIRAKPVAKVEDGDISSEGDIVKNSEPAKMVYNPVSDEVLVAVTSSQRINRVSLDGEYRGFIGGYGTADGQFDYLISVTVDKDRGDIYAMDQNTNLVQIFDSRGNFSGKWPVARPEGLRDFKEYGKQQIEAIEWVDGLLAMTDSRNNAILFFDPAGKFVKFFQQPDETKPGNLKTPTYLSANPLVSTELYVVNGEYGRWDVFNVETGELLRSISTRGADPGQFLFISGCYVDETGRVWGADGQATFLQAFDQEGKYLGTLAQHDKDKALPVTSPKFVLVRKNRIFVGEGRAKRLSIWEFVQK